MKVIQLIRLSDRQTSIGVAVGSMTQCVEQLLIERDIDDRNPNRSEAPGPTRRTATRPALVPDISGPRGEVFNIDGSRVESLPVREWW